MTGKVIQQVGEAIRDPDERQEALLSLLRYEQSHNIALNAEDAVKLALTARRWARARKAYHRRLLERALMLEQPLIECSNTLDQADRIALRDAMRQLKGKERAVIALTLQGLDNVDIGATLSMSPESARVYKHRAIERMRAMLA